MWSPDWPAKLHFLDVLPYRVTVFGRQSQDPLADWIATVRADIEPCWELFCAVNHPVHGVCHFWHILARYFSSGRRLLKLAATASPAPGAASPSNPVVFCSRAHSRGR